MGRARDLAGLLGTPPQGGGGGFVVASEAEAVAGIDNGKGITPLRLAQALAQRPRLRPDVARTRGIKNDVNALTLAKEKYKPIIPQAVSYDTAGLIMVDGGGAPTGYIRVQRSGYYRFAGQIVFEQDIRAVLARANDPNFPSLNGLKREDNKGASMYYNLYGGATTQSIAMIGSDVDGNNVLIYGNNNQIYGAHPTIRFDDVIPVDLAGNPAKYFYTLAQYVWGDGPNTHKLFASQSYASLSVEYVGPLT